MSAKPRAEPRSGVSQEGLDQRLAEATIDGAMLLAKKLRRKGNEKVMNCNTGGSRNTPGIRGLGVRKLVFIPLRLGSARRCFRSGHRISI